MWKGSEIAVSFITLVFLRQHIVTHRYSLFKNPVFLDQSLNRKGRKLEYKLSDLFRKKITEVYRTQKVSEV